MLVVLIFSLWLQFVINVIPISTDIVIYITLCHYNSSGNFSELFYLDLSINSIHGTLPYTITTLISLEILYLSENKLRGIIPSSLQALKSIIKIDLSNNLMTGSIPDLFYDLNRLSAFEIENNLLTGSLPTSIASLASLTDLIVQNNSLSGDLINVFNGSHQSKLTTVLLSNN